MKQSKKAFNVLSALLMLILFTGCPYESRVPASEKPFEIPKNLIGKWINAESLASEFPDYFVLSSNDRKTVLLHQFEYNSVKSGYDTTLWSGIFSSIKGSLFLSIAKMPEPGSLTDPFSEEETKYSIYRVRPFGQFYKFDELSSEIKEQFATSSEFEMFISENMDNELFYNTGTEVYLKSTL